MPQVGGSRPRFAAYLGPTADPERTTGKLKADKTAVFVAFQPRSGGMRLAAGVSPR